MKLKNPNTQESNLYVSPFFFQNYYIEKHVQTTMEPI